MGLVACKSHHQIWTWRLPWDNTHKEVYWRLALNGLPLASRMPPTPRPCQCGSHDPHPGRLHHYWTCPAAVAVADAVSTALGGVPLTRSNLWLARPPPGIHRGVWDVTCLASLAAMDGGRRMMVARSMAAPPRHPPRPRPPCRCCPPRRGPLVDLARRFLLCRHRPLFLAGGGPPHPPPLALGRTLLPLAACSRARVIACDGADPWLMPHHTPLPLPHILHPCRPITPPSPPPISRYHSRYPLQQGARCR